MMRAFLFYYLGWIEKCANESIPSGKQEYVMKTILTILLLTLSIATYADRSAVVNNYGNLQGYKATEGCYGTGCLPTAVLQEVLKQPSYYSQERIQNERLIDAIKESNEINKERLKLELENSNQE